MEYLFDIISYSYLIYIKTRKKNYFRNHFTDDLNPKLGI